MFLQLCVILFTGGSASVHAGIPPKMEAPTLPRRPPQEGGPLPRRPPKREPPGQGDPPQEGAPLPRRPPQEGAPPRRRPPQEGAPLQGDPPRRRHPQEGDPPQEGGPPQEADSGIQSMSCWYASYWNAFLFRGTVSRLSLSSGLVAIRKSPLVHIRD